MRERVNVYLQSPVQSVLSPVQCIYTFFAALITLDSSHSVCVSVQTQTTAALTRDLCGQHRAGFSVLMCPRGE